jgi:subtilase family serine protease
LIFASSLLAAPTTFAQNRISTNITNGTHVEIAGSVHPRARTATDLGATAGDTKLSMSLRFSMTDAQSAALDQLLADQQNPASPRYHQWLTPAQFGAEFGLSQVDIAKVTAWLAAQGFTVTSTANGRTFVSFDGTVAQADAAFGTSIHNLRSSDGEQHFANITNVTVPAALNGVVEGVTGLHDFRLKPRVKGSIAPAPEFTSSTSGIHYLAPGDLYTIYQMTPLLNGSPAITGAGMSIAIVGQVDINTADIAAFRTASGLSAISLSTVHANGVDPCTSSPTFCSSQSGQSNLEESSLDVEWSGAMAPSANIVFVNAPCALPGTGCGVDAMTWAVDNNLAPIVTSSYGLCEAGWGTTDIVNANAVFKQANAQGQTVVGSSGDSGATDCDAGPSAMEGLTADFPASSPYVTGMGGTMFNEGTATGATTYWNGSNNANSGSAISYIPESAWNDASYDAFGGGGGGSSAYFPKPAWQVGTVNDASRDVPDLALTASDAHDPFMFCVNVASAESCTNGYRIANGSLFVAGGTSFDSQIFGGMLALLEQKLGATTGLGNIDPKLYALANNSSYYSAGTTIASNGNVVFNDVTSGNNATACTAGTPNCLNGGSEGYNASSGYDLATGWGSVNLSNLASDWNKVTPLGSGSLGNNISTTTLTASPTSATTGSTITLTATVTGTAGTPTGTVQFLANDNAVTAPIGLIPLNSTTATATYSWTASCSAAGQQSVSAVYSGDINYQGSKGPALTAGGSATTSNGSLITSPVLATITGTCPDFSVTPSSGSGITVSGTNATVTVAAGGTIPSVTIAVAPLNGFSGTVAFSYSGTTTSGYLPTVTLSPSSVNISGSTSASTTVSLSGITADSQIPTKPKEAGQPWYEASGGIAVASLLMIVFPHRRRLGGLLAVLLAVALALGASGCSSSSSSSSTGTTTTGGTTTTNPYAGTYTVTVIATYSNNGQSTVHASTITYSIN